MELNENQLSTAGGVLGGIGALWAAILMAIAGIVSRAKWKGRVEASIEENTNAIQGLEDKVDNGFEGVQQRIDNLIKRGDSHGIG